MRTYILAYKQARNASHSSLALLVRRYPAHVLMQACVLSPPFSDSAYARKKTTGYSPVVSSAFLYTVRFLLFSEETGNIQRLLLDGTLDVVGLLDPDLLERCRLRLGLSSLYGTGLLQSQIRRRKSA